MLGKRLLSKLVFFEVSSNEQRLIEINRNKQQVNIKLVSELEYYPIIETKYKSDTTKSLPNGSIQKKQPTS